MENMIKTIKISQLFGDKDIEWNLQKTNVLVGKNGMGKSTVLQLVVNTISQEEIHDKSKLCSEVTIELDSNNILKLRKSQENISNLLDLVDEQEMKRLIIKEVREGSANGAAFKIAAMVFPQIPNSFFSVWPKEVSDLISRTDKNMIEYSVFDMKISLLVIGLLFNLL